MPDESPGSYAAAAEDEYTMRHITPAFLRAYEAVHALPALEIDSLPLILRWQARGWALFDLAEVAELGPWRDWEWRHTESQIALVEGICKHLTTRG